MSFKSFVELYTADKLNVPYSAERRKADSELAKKNIQNLQQGKK